MAIEVFMSESRRFGGSGRTAFQGGEESIITLSSAGGA